jgi:hypothetical protein
MGQLDRTALLAPHATQRLGLDHAAWLQAMNLAHPLSLMPYELAEIEESSLALEEAITEGDASSAPISPWRFVD